MFIRISDILVEDRERKEFLHVDEIANSIKEYGLIQPIILNPVNGVGGSQKAKLVAGECRLRAMRRLGWSQLEHGKHFLWNAEVNQDELRSKAIELEENIRRKALTWQEEVSGKQKLLEIMQRIHGPAIVGNPRTADANKAYASGFGVRRLSALLGENVATTSKDLSLARAMTTLPLLKAAQTKNAALRQVNLLANVASMTTASSQQDASDKPWTLYEGSFLDHSLSVPDESVDLIYTDLPYGVDLDQMSKIHGGVDYQDKLTSVVQLIPTIASESMRVLKYNRFAVFFFGFRYYATLVMQLEVAGFSVDPMPFIWFKNTRTSEQPHCIYARSYDAALIARKGSPTFIRQGQQNFLQLAPVTGDANRLHAAQQPVALVEKFIIDMVTPGATILDFFAGSGTTGVAAIKHNCKVILFEKEPLAIEVIKGRLAQTVKRS